MSNQQVSISEAAKLVRKSPKTLYAAIKSGKLSVTSDHKGQKIIAISELIRIYGELNQAKEKQPYNDEILELKHKIELLSKENESLNQRLDDKDKHLDDLRQATKLLEHQQQTNIKGFIRRIFK